MQPVRRPKRVSHVLQFLIILVGTDPLVWRRIQVPERYSFWDLHVAIQDAMGWQDYHLHEFRVADREGRVERVGIPDEDGLYDRPCRYPQCLAGTGACPPEDCGGVSGYAEFLQAIRDRRHPEHRAMLEWVGRPFDPNDFDPSQVSFDNPRKRWQRAFQE